jgi:general secretion pathway protein H
MSMLQHHGTTAEAGFTLIEMLVVLTILAVTMTFAGPLLSGGSQGTRLQLAANELASAVRLTRSAAITRNTETSLTIDVDKRSFASTVVNKRLFAPEIEAKVRFAGDIGAAASDGAFRFFPDGSSTGGDVTLSLRGSQAKLCVYWLTGEVRRDAAC